jgi:predicted AlkP superfamily pyrophosphatase or phosphodiesterase
MRFIFLLLLPTVLFSQVNKTLTNKVERPKLIVGLVVDQMRWDYLYRFYNRYSPDGGFRRLLTKGFSCENNFINYVPSYTACGHSTIFTGSVPAISGIAGNEWWEVLTKREMYCVQDDSVRGVGTSSRAGQMSPKNLLVTTIGDELRLATNFKGKVIGISFKDRGCILPAGHSANAAYWYEPASGKFISSTWYMNDLPQWVTDFNNKKLPDVYFKQGWNTLYPISTYTQSAPDEETYEGKPLGADQKGFPYKLDKYIGTTNYGALTSTPYGNTLTKEMAIAAVNAEQLGKDSVTDMLTVSFSSPDYIGHSFGPNSVEVEDNYLRLDKDLGELFSFLDSKVGKGQYLVFISADHGAAHIPAFLKSHKLPGGTISGGVYMKAVDSILRKRYGNYSLIETEQNNQFFLNHRLLDSLNINQKDVSKLIIDFMKKQDIVERVFEISELSNETMPEKMKSSIINGYYPKRGGDIEYTLKPGYFEGGETGTTHGSAFPYDTHIPLVWYGWNIKPGKTNRETHMTDVAPTVAAMLRIQMPSGNVGSVIEEVSGK